VWKLWKHLTIFQLPVTVFLGSLRYMAWWKAHQKPLRNSWRRRALAFRVAADGLGRWVLLVFSLWVEVLLLGEKGDVYVKVGTCLFVVIVYGFLHCVWLCVGFRVYFGCWQICKCSRCNGSVFFVRFTAWHTSKHLAKKNNRQPLGDAGCCGDQEP